MPAPRFAVPVVAALSLVVTVACTSGDDSPSPDPVTVATTSTAAPVATTTTTAAAAPNPDAVQYAAPGTYVYSVFQNCCDSPSNRETHTVTGAGPQIHDVAKQFVSVTPPGTEQRTYERRDGALFLTRSLWRYNDGSTEDCDWKPDILVMPDPITDRQWSTDSWCDVASRRGRIRAVAEQVKVSRPHDTLVGGRAVRAWDVTARYEQVQRYNSDGGFYEKRGCNIETREFAPSLGLIVSSKGFCIDQPGGQSEAQFVYNRTLVTS